MDTIFKGTITELKCKTYFLELGYVVSTPEIPARYDFILDTGDRLLKIQVKSCKSDGKTIYFDTCSTHYARGTFVRVNYLNDNIDYFCTWYKDECYLVPISECGKVGKRLRITPTKNSQRKNVCLAKDYIAKEVLSR